MSSRMTLGVLHSAPSPLAGEGWGGGSWGACVCFAIATPLPTARRAVDLPRKGGGEEKRWELAR